MAQPVVRATIDFPEAMHTAAKSRASALGMTFAKFIRFLVADSLTQGPNPDQASYTTQGEYEGRDMASRRNALAGHDLSEENDLPAFTEFGR